MWSRRTVMVRFSDKRLLAKHFSMEGECLQSSMVTQYCKTIALRWSEWAVQGRFWTALYFMHASSSYSLKYFILSLFLILREIHFQNWPEYVILCMLLLLKGIYTLSNLGPPPQLGWVCILSVEPCTVAIS